jgi:hypothetical protein
MTYERLMEHAEAVRRGAIEATMATLDGRAEYRAGVEREFADVPDAFRPLVGFPDPRGYGAKVDDLMSVLRGLSTGDSSDPMVPAGVEIARMHSTAAALQCWTGVAAQRFRGGFLDRMPALVRNQFAVAVVLRAALLAQQEIWARAREDADQIAEKTLEALDASVDCTRTEWTLTFTVVASAAAVVAVPLSGGASLALGAVGAVAQVVAATGPAEAPQTSFSADEPGEVVERMRDAIALLRGHIRERQDGVAAALRATRELMTDRRELFGWE